MLLVRGAFTPWMEQPLLTATGVIDRYYFELKDIVDYLGERWGWYEHVTPQRYREQHLICDIRYRLSRPRRRLPLPD